MQQVGELTQKQREVLAHFTDASRTSGAPPSIRAVMRHFGFSTPRGAEVHLRALAAKGYLLHSPRGTPAYRPRFLDEGTTLPILGRVPAGYPSEQPELQEGTLMVPWKFSEVAFAIVVVGPSMQDANVVDGDLVVVDRKRHPRDGDIVLAFLGGEQTVKRLRMAGTGWRLEPANPAFPTLFPSEDRDYIVGPVVALVRRTDGARS